MVDLPWQRVDILDWTIPCQGLTVRGSISVLFFKLILQRPSQIPSIVCSSPTLPEHVACFTVTKSHMTVCEPASLDSTPSHRLPHKIFRRRSFGTAHQQACYMTRRLRPSGPSESQRISQHPRHSDAH